MEKKRINLEDLDRKNVFKVPEGYFEEMAVQLEDEMKVRNFGENKAKENLHFSTPPDYFDNLADSIFSKINLKSAVKIEVEKLEKANVFSVADNYFEELPNKILSKVDLLNKKSSINAKSVSRSSVFRLTWPVRRVWAAAASVVLVIGGFWFFLSTTKNDNSIELKNVSKQEIIQYLQDQDLSYLDDAPLKTNKANSYVTDSLIIKNLNLSQKDILKHLESENIAIDI